MLVFLYPLQWHSHDNVWSYQIDWFFSFCHKKYSLLRWAFCTCYRGTRQILALKWKIRVVEAMVINKWLLSKILPSEFVIFFITNEQIKNQKWEIKSFFTALVTHIVKLLYYKRSILNAYGPVGLFKLKSPMNASDLGWGPRSCISESSQGLLMLLVHRTQSGKALVFKVFVYRLQGWIVHQQGPEPI